MDFCPSCWREIEPEAECCPVCRYDLAAYLRLGYQEKLILALRHPIRENRLIAIQVLGDLKSEQAVGAFREILRQDDNFYILREVLEAAWKIGSQSGRSLVEEATRHPSRLVSTFARSLLSARETR